MKQLASKASLNPPRHVRMREALLRIHIPSYNKMWLPILVDVIYEQLTLHGDRGFRNIIVIVMFNRGGGSGL